MERTRETDREEQGERQEKTLRGGGWRERGGGKRKYIYIYIYTYIYEEIETEIEADGN